MFPGLELTVSHDEGYGGLDIHSTVLAKTD